eukprot:COSAG02_NODE_56797_length_283_cov_1.407609_1_plen_25_part_01
MRSVLLQLTWLAARFHSNLPHECTG